MTTSLLGKTLSHYKLVELIGEGDIATVYKAYQQSLNRWVAVKVLHSNDQNVLARFEREAKAVARLRHRNILMVYEYGVVENLPFIAMEYVEQGTLESHLTGKPLPWTQAVSIAISVAEALHYAHGHGLIHRDVKPSNILLPQQDWPLLGDFGMVKVSDADKALTATGLIMGSPAYIAPEQARGEKIGIHADMYALGIILFKMVTGQLPFDFQNTNRLMLAHLQDDPPSVRSLNQSCPADLEKIILKTLEKSPRDRYDDMEAMIAALRRVLGTSTIDVDIPDSAELEVFSSDVPSKPFPSSDEIVAASNNAQQAAIEEPRLLLPDQNIAIPLILNLGEDGVVIGRIHGKNQVDVDLGPYGGVELGISRRHSRLTLHNGKWLINDLGSTNGTQLNNIKLTPGTAAPLKNGDILQFGRMHLVFLTFPENDKA